jgi:hypothetical protein
MGTTYHYANLTKREWFSASAFGENAKISGLGRSLSSRAFDLLLADLGKQHEGTGLVEIGRWSGDAITIIGDTDDAWGQYRDTFTALDADVILLIHATDGFEEIATAANRSDSLFIQLCHLVATHQTPQLEPHMNQHFGSNFFQRYKRLCTEMPWFEPKDLNRARGR